MPVSCTVKEAIKFLKSPIKKPLLVKWDELDVGVIIQEAIDSRLCYWAKDDAKLTDFVIGRKVNSNQVYVIAIKLTKSRIRDFLLKFMLEYPGKQLVAHRHGKFKTYNPSALWKKLQ